MSFWHRLLYLVGLRQDPHPHTYTFTSDLHTFLADLANQEQRSPEEIAEQLLSQALQERQTASQYWVYWQSLTTREKQVTALLCSGYSNMQIANLLGVSIQTVKSHVSNLLAKFGLDSRMELKLLLKDWDFSEWLPPNHRP